MEEQYKRIEPEFQTGQGVFLVSSVYGQHRHGEILSMIWMPKLQSNVYMVQLEDGKKVIAKANELR